MFEDVNDNYKSTEDSGEYLRHCRPKSGTGRAVATEVLEHLDKYEAEISKLKMDITDGTSKMTGCCTGALAMLERRLYMYSGVVAVLNPELLTVIRELPPEVQANLSRDIKYALGIEEVFII